MPRLSEQFKIVPILEPENHQAAALTCDSINLKNYSWCIIIMTFGELTADEIITVHSGATTDADSQDVTFAYAYTGADLKTAGGDIITVTGSAATLTLAAATFEDRMLVIDIDPATLTDGYSWISVIGDGSATELFASAVAILTPKYASAAAHTAISV